MTMVNGKNNSSTTTNILWAVFLSLLVVLLPHTAWAFRKFEPDASEAFVLWSSASITITTSDVISYIAAFAFEAAIAVLVHKLAEHLGKKIPTSAKGNFWKLFIWRYMNPLAFALVIVTAVSGLANLAHAVEYGQELSIFAKWGIPPSVYMVAFGGILPLLSLTFARVLSTIAEDEESPNPEVEEAKKTVLSLRQQLRESEAARRSAEEKAILAEARFASMSELAKALFAEDKRQRIVFVHKQWPQLPNSAISIIAEASPSYVSETLSEIGSD